MVHHGLEHSRGIGETEEHHSWFEDAKGSFEHCLPLIPLLDPNVIVAPADVKFSKNKCMDQICDCLLDVWQWAVILDSIFIQNAIVLHRAILTILFRHVKHA